MSELTPTGSIAGLEAPVQPAERPAVDPGSPTPARRLLSPRLLVPLLRRPDVVLSAAVLVTAVLAAVAPSLFTSRDPFATAPAAVLLPPGSDGHVFGTDAVGRDLLSRVVYGTSISLESAVIAVLVALTGGSSLGLVAGYVGGRIDDLIMRAVDVMLAFPALLLAMAVISVLGFGPMKVAVAVGVVGVAAMARLMRSEVLRVRTTAFVEAAQVCGANRLSALVRHVLPNAAGPVLVLATLDFGTAILAVSSLSFLGFGAPPPSPEWGSLIADGRNYLASAWWLCALPGLVVATVVLATNRVSRALDGEQQGPAR